MKFEDIILRLSERGEIAKTKHGYDTRHLRGVVNEIFRFYKDGIVTIDSNLKFLLSYRGREMIMTDRERLERKRDDLKRQVMWKTEEVKKLKKQLKLIEKNLLKKKIKGFLKIQ